MSQALLKDNVVALERRNRDNKNVVKDIYSYLYRLNIGFGEDLQSTAAIYERDIKKFFKLMWGKNLDQLEVIDLDILPSDIEKYQTYLVNFGYKSNTVNRTIQSVKSLYTYFEENRYRYKNDEDEWVNITANIFNGVGNVNLDDKDGYGIFSDNEIKTMIHLAKTLDNGERKSLAIEFASVTSFRLEAVAGLNIKTDFFFMDNTWVAKVFDKKKVNEKAIRTELYERLRDIADEDGTVFNFTSRTLQRTVDTLIGMMEIDKEERNLTFHSIKKYGIGEVYAMTNGDMKSIAIQGNHASYETTMKYYIAFSQDYSKMPCLQIGQPLDTSPIQELDREQLISLFMSATRSTQYELLNLLQKNEQ